MDYEKKYKNALEWARQVMNGETGFIRKEVEEVFPELKEESEDERIRKEIINYFEHHPNIIVKRERKSDYIAWLERVGKQRSAWGEEDEKFLDGIIANLEYLMDRANSYTLKQSLQKRIDWLKSLRPKTTWKPSESTILLLESMANGKANPQDFQASLGGLIGQLKKLREE